MGLLLVGLTQRDPKANLASSRISQMGIIATLVGVALAVPPPRLGPRPAAAGVDRAGGPAGRRRDLSPKPWAGAWPPSGAREPSPQPGAQGRRVHAVRDGVYLAVLAILLA